MVSLKSTDSGKKRRTAGKRCKFGSTSIILPNSLGSKLKLFRYIHKITRTRSPIRPEEMGGGVLADEMGLGKTLSTLALTVRTLEEGREWAQKKRSGEHTSGKIQRHTHSTLVIVPSACE